MARYNVISKRGDGFGQVEATSELDALINFLAERGYGSDVVMAQDGKLVFVDDEQADRTGTSYYRGLVGDETCWTVMKVA